MAEIKFETGVKTFSLNGAVDVSFAPTDFSFIEKVYRCLENMDRRQDGYKAVAEQTNDAAVFDLARQMDADAREEINAVFGLDVCTPVFGDLNVFAVGDGLPVWANLILAIIDTFEGSFAEEKKKTNPRIKKYTDKYKR